MRGILWAVLTLGLYIVPGPVCARDGVEASIREQIAILASDEFEGRKPGTPGEEKTVQYIAEKWREAGLKPAAKSGGWFEPVPLIQKSPADNHFEFRADTRKLRFAADDILFLGREAKYQKSGVPVIFAGYGITVDGTPVTSVAGKAVMIMLDEPENAPENLRSARSRREILIDAGAEVVLVVADNEQGRWSAIRRQIMSQPIALESADKRAPLEAYISSQFAIGLVSAAGGDWDQLKNDAKSGESLPVDLGVRANFDVQTNIRHFNSRNIIGKIPGRKPGNGVVLFLGHWDHLGICRPMSGEDKICNGAVDNASGIAALTEIAAGLSHGRHDRDIYFLATTAEESGLLGAYSFTENPPFKLDDIIIALNLDTIAIAPKGAKVAIMGRGRTGLDSVIDATAKRLGRKVESSLAANSFIQRQDGWALSQKNVPALMVGGSFADQDLLRAFLSGPYHDTNDEMNDQIELGGAVEDVALHIELGRLFASKRKYKGK